MYTFLIIGLAVALVVLLVVNLVLIVLDTSTVTVITLSAISLAVCIGLGVVLYMGYTPESTYAAVKPVEDTASEVKTEPISPLAQPGPVVPENQQFSTPDVPPPPPANVGGRARAHRYGGGYDYVNELGYGANLNQSYRYYR